MPWRESIKKRLTPEMAVLLDRVPPQRASSLLEIRLYTGCRPLFVYPWGYETDGCVMDEACMQDVIAALTGYALFSCERQMAQGYIPLDGGHRAGVCGRMTREADGMWRMAKVYSVCLRISRRVPRAAEGIYACLTDENGMPRSVLLLGPPGCGKTTLLRDSAEYLAGEAGLRVSAADEREELFPACGEGKCLNVLSGCGKAMGMMMLLRTMSPQVIVCDEIGSADDAAAIKEASRCGAAVLASAHAGGLNDLFRRPALKNLFDARTFDFYVLLGHMGAVKAILDAEGRRMQGEMDDGQLGCCRHGDDCRQRSGICAL